MITANATAKRTISIFNPEVLLPFDLNPKYKYVKVVNMWNL